MEILKQLAGEVILVESEKKVGFCNKMQAKSNPLDQTLDIQDGKFFIYPH